MVDLLDVFTVKNMLRLVLFVFMFGYAAFAFLLSLRIGILAKTLETPRSSFVALLAKVHFLVVLIGCIIIGVLILF